MSTKLGSICIVCVQLRAQKMSVIWSSGVSNPKSNITVKDSKPQHSKSTVEGDLFYDYGRKQS